MTKKRMIKLLMATGYSRNVANEVAFYIVVQGLQYKDFREILEEIRGKADVICSRYASMTEDMDAYNEIAKRIIPTEANPYPLASLNFHFDFDLCNQYRLTRVLKMHYRRKARRAVKRLSATMRKAGMAASEAADAFGNFATAFGSENGFVHDLHYEAPPQTNLERIKYSFRGKPNPFLPSAESFNNIIGPGRFFELLKMGASE